MDAYEDDVEGEEVSSVLLWLICALLLVFAKMFFKND